MFGEWNQPVQFTQFAVRISRFGARDRLGFVSQPFRSVAMDTTPANEIGIGAHAELPDQRQPERQQETEQMTSPAYSYDHTDWDTSYWDTPPGNTAPREAAIGGATSASDALSTDEFIEELFAITGSGERPGRDRRHLQAVAREFMPREFMPRGPDAVAAAVGLAAAPTRGPSVALRITVLVAAIVAMVFLFFPTGVQAGSAVPTTISHVVQPSDTLWELAHDIMPAGGDIRATVDLIRDANGMTTSLLVIGDLIAIPVLR